MNSSAGPNPKIWITISDPLLRLVTFLVELSRSFSNYYCFHIPYCFAFVLLFKIVSNFFNLLVQNLSK